MVRYRLLFLTSAPIFLTMFALMGMTLYWSVHYTWNSALVNVSERLDVADNSLRLLQKSQVDHMTAFKQSYDFRVRLNNAGKDDLASWVSKQKHQYELDFLHWRPIKNVSEVWRYFEYSRKASFFDRLESNELSQLDAELVKQAEVPLIESDQVERNGLVSRTILPVYNESKQIIGFLDGGLLLNNSSLFVDKIRDLIYPLQQDSERPLGTVTIFLDDIRVSTNVPLDSQSRQGRAIGTRASSEVKKQVLGDGKEWRSHAYVHDAWYISAYQPLYDKSGDAIGMLYTGYLIWPLIQTYITNIGELSIIIIILLLVSGVVVYRGARDLFNPIEKIHKVVKQVQLGEDKRIGRLGLNDQHELAQLAKQFDNMLDLLTQRNNEIQQGAQELEDKVRIRTASLNEKTLQLEHHINLLHQTRNKLIVNEKLAALGELTAGIAHEINNPTAVILGNVELIKFELGQHAESVDDEISAILTQIDRIRNITRSLLQYSRQGGVQDEITWQHITPIIEESITLVKTGAKKKGISYQVSLQAKVSVEVNRNQLLQILVNLQMNAIHAMNGEGQLSISSEDWVEQGLTLGAIIHIQDQGCGIKPEQLKRIFDPFYTTKRDGTGLGLSVSQSILSHTGGEIRVTSEVGVGSCFSIYLPSKAEHEGEERILTIS
ncbi:two-component sensor histidine kinase [Vibrio sp. 10N.286.49.B3]|uniref:sensor histidine kinase n=1 Tax=Vibrio sp. 10N.286.49.B3 TaxID=1880855 RepID=UPI000C8622EE|nr:HAMP domain-containing sensor histidine kinase [Vibrio sp. 10N.286.49.B3]PMH46879.1 two-component sensor histidine kinase [Vibrio sp. 10N.286.49.B3]